MFGRFLNIFIFSIFVVSCGGGNPNFNENVKSFADTVVIDFENDATESLIPPKIDFGNLIGGSNYVLHGNDSCTQELISFTFPEGQSTYQLDVPASNFPENETVQLYLEGKWSDGSDFCMSLDQSFKLLVDSGGGDGGGTDPGGGDGGGTDPGGSLSAPSVIGLGVGTEPISNSANFTVNVLGVEEGDVVNLFSDSSCSQTPVNLSGVFSTTTSAGETQVSFSLNALADDTYTLYANRSANGETSSCTSVGVTYEFDSTVPLDPVITFLGGALSDTGFSDLISLRITMLSEGSQESVRLFKGTTCDSANEIGDGFVVSSGELVAEEKIFTDFDISSLVESNAAINISAKIVDAAGNTGNCGSSSISYHKIDDSLAPSFSSSAGDREAKVSYSIAEPFGENFNVDFFPDNITCSGVPNVTTAYDEGQEISFPFYSSGAKSFSVRMSSGDESGTCHALTHTVNSFSPSFSFTESKVANPGFGNSAEVTATWGFMAGDNLKVFAGATCDGIPISSVDLEADSSSVVIDPTASLSASGDTSFSFLINDDANSCNSSSLTYSKITPSVSFDVGGAGSAGAPVVGSDEKPVVNIIGFGGSENLRINLFSVSCEVGKCKAGTGAFAFMDVSGSSSYSFSSSSASRDTLVIGDHSYRVEIYIKTPDNSYNKYSNDLFLYYRKKLNLNLVSPASTPSSSKNLTFSNSEGESGQTLSLFFDSSCSGTTFTDSYTADPASVNMVVSDDESSGQIPIYAKVGASECIESYQYDYDEDPPGDISSMSHQEGSSETQYLGRFDVTAKIMANNFELNELFEFYLENDCSGDKVNVVDEQGSVSDSYQILQIPEDDIVNLNLSGEIAVSGDYEIFLKRIDSVGNSRCINEVGKTLTFRVNSNPSFSIVDQALNPLSLSIKELSTVNTNLLADITSIETTIRLADTHLLTASNDNFDVYIKINSEVMKVLSINGNDLIVERNHLGTTASLHNSGDAVERIYAHNTAPVSGVEETVLTVDHGSKFSASTDLFPNYIKIGNEVMKVVSVVDDTLTVERGAFGTTKSAHNVNSTISKVIQAYSSTDVYLKITASNLPTTSLKTITFYSDPRCKLSNITRLNVGAFDSTASTSTLESYFPEAGQNNLYAKVRNLNSSGETDCLPIPIFIEQIPVVSSADLQSVDAFKHYILANDIDIADDDTDCSSSSGAAVWTPLSLGDNEFNGSIYGNGKTICGMNINVNSNYAGLFERLGKKSLIYYLNFKNVNVTNNSTSTSSSTGVLAGYAKGIIERVEIDNTSTVKGEHNVGGLVGIGEEIAIRKSSSGADVSCIDTSTGDLSCGGSGKGTNVGGLVGHLKGIENYYSAFGDGELPGPSTIADSYATGDVTGREKVGGLVGFSEGIIIFAYSSGSVSGDNRVGGLIGEAKKFYGTYLTYSFSASSVISNDIYTGAGLIGLTNNQNGVYGGWHTDNFCLNKDHGSGEYRSYSACSTSNQCAASSMGSTISAGADINNSTDTNISVDDVTPFYTCNETSIALNTGINDSAIEVTVSDSSTLAPGNFIKFGDEVMEISSLGSSNLLNVSRGVFSSEKSSHSSGSLLSVCEKRKYIQIDEEVIEILDIGASKVLTVNRGVLDTQAGAHLGGSLVRVYRCLESSGGIETEVEEYPSAAPSTKKDLTVFTTGLCSGFRFNCDYDWTRESGSLPTIRRTGLDFSNLAVTADQVAINPGSLGVREAPLEIYSTKQWDVIQNNEFSNSNYIKLKSDLDFSASGAPAFEGLTDRIYYSYFSGVLDGGHHSFNGINQIVTNNSYIGSLVPKASGAEIKNLAFDGIESSGSYSHKYEYNGSNYGNVVNKLSYGTTFRNLYFNNIKLSADGVYNSFISGKSVFSLSENIYIENSLIQSPNGTSQYNGFISGLTITGKQKKIHIENSRLENIIYYSGGLNGRTTADSDISFVEADVTINTATTNPSHSMIGGITGLSYLNNRYENISVKGEIKGNGINYGGVLGVGIHSYLNNIISTVDISSLDDGSAPQVCGGAVGSVHSGGNQLEITNSIFLGNINCDGTKDYGITYNHRPTLNSNSENIDNNYWLSDSLKVNTDEFCHRTDDPDQYAGSKEPPCLTPGSLYNFTTENEALDFLNFETIPSPISSAPGGLGWSQLIWAQDSEQDLPGLIIFK